MADRNIAPAPHAAMIADLDLIRDAISVSDAAEKACPVNQGRIKGSEVCPLCGALSNQTCFRTASADYRAMQMVRTAVASCGTRPKGGDAHAAPALPSDAAPEGRTPNPSRPIPDTLNAGGCE